MIVEKGDLLVRKLKSDDKYLISKWLSDPKILQFYEGRDNPFDVARVEEKFYGIVDEEIRCIVEYTGKPIGYIQFYEVEANERCTYGYEDLSENIFGMDQFIGESAYWNKGVGTLLVKTMVDYLFNEKGADRIVMDPQTWNERALRCYEKCGFTKVKLLPENELHEGEYRDCWLIEYSGNVCIGF